MHYSITNQMNSLKEICRRHKVKRLWIFGSVLGNDFNEESDIDLLYELDEQQINEKEYLRNLFSWVDEMEKLLGRKVDLTWYPGIKNPYFKEEVDENKILIYDSSGEEIFI